MYGFKQSFFFCSYIFIFLFYVRFSSIPPTTQFLGYISSAIFRVICFHTRTFVITEPKERSSEITAVLVFSVKHTSIMDDYNKFKSKYRPVHPFCQMNEVNTEILTRIFEQHQALLSHNSEIQARYVFSWLQLSNAVEMEV